LPSADRTGAAYNYRYNNRARLDRLTIGSTVTADYSDDGLVPLSQKVAFEQLENRDIEEIHRPTNEVRDGSPQIRR